MSIFRRTFLPRKVRRVTGGVCASPGRPTIPHIFIGGEERKSCSKCGRVLPLSEFGVKTDAGDKLTYSCKGCLKK